MRARRRFHRAISLLAFDTAARALGEAARSALADAKIFSMLPLDDDASSRLPPAVAVEGETAAGTALCHCLMASLAARPGALMKEITAV